ncbi:MAG TPA: trigger factor [Candidatus Omnitrophota bacterium]|nr:trigger factor [Candidatus Omnitrophota bacterium]HPS19855.1 trigger factor [Candidatus Omnitrophota bacterium]
MKSKLKKLNGTSRQFDITLSKDRVKEEAAKVLSDIAKEVTIPGFRKGKAPEDLVYKNYKDDVYDEVKKRIIPLAYQNALEEHKIDPISYPELSDVAMDKDGGMSFVAKVDVYPEFKIAKYEGIKINSEKTDVSEKEVTEAIERIQNVYAEFETVDRPVKKGDFSVCSIEAFVGDKVISKKRDKVWIEANKESSMLGLGEEIVGLKVGEAKDIEVDLPADYPDKNYAGKKAMFKVEVKEVREKKLPQANDELAQKLNVESLEKLKEQMKNQILETKKNGNQNKMKAQVAKYLIDKHSFDLPETMVRRQLEVLVRNAEEELMRKGVDEKTIMAHKDKLKEQLQKEAENKVKLYFVLEQISKEEKIEISDDDVDNWLKSVAEHYNKPVDEVKKYYEENDLLGGVREQLREEKALDRLIEKAAVTTK